MIPAHDDDPRPRTYAGHEWLYVLRGRLHIQLGDHDFFMGAGEAAEFDCQIPHWFGAAGRGTVEILSLFGKSGERIHLRTPRRRAAGGDADGLRLPSVNRSAASAIP